MLSLYAGLCPHGFTSFGYSPFGRPRTGVKALATGRQIFLDLRIFMVPSPPCRQIIKRCQTHPEIPSVRLSTFLHTPECSLLHHLSADGLFMHMMSTMNLSQTHWLRQSTIRTAREV